MLSVLHLSHQIPLLKCYYHISIKLKSMRGKSVSNDKVLEQSPMQPSLVLLGPIQKKTERQQESYMTSLWANYGQGRVNTIMQFISFNEPE